VRDNAFNRWKGQKFSDFKVPRQYTLVFLMGLSLREGKALESEKCKGLVCELCYE
jgi:hypothetical protein